MAKDIAGLTNAVVQSLERVPIRTRESGVTRSAWRMEVGCDAGTGSITLLEEGLFRGDGMFLGATQEQLADTYRALLDPNEETPFEPMQLG